MSFNTGLVTIKYNAINMRPSINRVFYIKEDLLMDVSSGLRHAAMAWCVEFKGGCSNTPQFLTSSNFRNSFSVKED